MVKYVMEQSPNSYAQPLQFRFFFATSSCLYKGHHLHFSTTIATVINIPAVFTT